MSKYYFYYIFLLFSNQLNHSKKLLHFRKVSKQIFFAVNDARCGRITKPLREKTRSMRADV